MYNIKFGTSILHGKAMSSSEEIEAECYSFESSDESGDEGEMREYAGGNGRRKWGGGAVKYDCVHMLDQAFSKQSLNKF